MAKTMLQKLTALVGVNTGQINLNAEAAKRLGAEKKSAQAAQITKDMLSKLPELAALMETKNAALQDSVGAELGSLLGSLEKMAEGKLESVEQTGAKSAESLAEKMR